MRRRRAAPALALLAALLAGCAVNPATGERQLALISESQEVAMGREADAELVTGGDLLEDPELEAYVSRIGRRLAAASERPDLPWTFRILDDPAVNAFALPGGFVYLTRGILTHFVNEAQLAAVLGHEIGHVTARHHVSQASRAQLAQLGLGLGALLAGDAAPLAGVAQTGLQLLLLKYSREAENQADTLGLRYMTAAGWEPAEMAEVLEMLADVGEAQEGSGLPGWLSTHPEPAERAQRIRAEQEPGAEGAGRVERAAYLQRVDGLAFGPDPREGYFEEGRFYHPELAFTVDFPAGWRTLNQRQAVVGISPERDAVLALGMAEGDSPEAAARTFAARQDLRALEVEAVRAGEGRGFRVAFEATDGSARILGIALFLPHQGRVFQLLGYAAADRFEARRDALLGWLASFRRLEDPDRLRVAPLRLEVVRLPSRTTLRALAEDRPSAVPLEVLARINQVEADAPLEPGLPVKRVVRGEPEAR